jgi:anti-sigma B factor antagonist
MALDIEEKEIEGITIVSLRGRLTAGDEAAALDTKLRALIAAAKPSVVLDLKHVGMIDSTGLGVLVANYSKFTEAGGALKLLHASARHSELLVLTKLTTVFQMFDDEQQAINSFFPDRDVPRFDILDFVKSEREEERRELPGNEPQPERES